MELNEHPTVIEYRKKVEENASGTAPKELDGAWLKGVAVEAGADDAGLVEINAHEIEDQREEILSIFPQTRSLMSIVCRMNPENIRCPSRDVSDLEFLQTFEHTNAVSRRIGKALAEQGVKAMTPSAGFPMDLSKWPGKMWPLSHKTIAEAAGLGRMGHNRLLIHPRFGNFIVLGTLLLDREVTPCDQPLSFNPCLECRLCVSVCPVGAICPDGHFTFTGKEPCEGTVVIKDKGVQVEKGLVGTPHMQVTADSETWLDFLAGEENLLWALARRKFRMKGSPRLMKAFARCFP